MSFARARTSDGKRNKDKGTEAILTRAFAKFLLDQRRPTTILPRFSDIHFEVPGTFGVADLVGVVAPSWQRAKQSLVLRFDRIPRGPAAAIVALLHYGVPRTKEYILRRSQFSQRVTRGALNSLVSRKVVRDLGKGRFVLAARFKYPTAQIYFFELKLDKWKRALYQAAQARAYANKAYCVFPKSKKAAIAPHRKIFQTMGVGVLLFDAASRSITEAVRTRRRPPSTERNRIDVVLRIASAAGENAFTPSRPKVRSSRRK